MQRTVAHTSPGAVQEGRQEGHRCAQEGCGERPIESREGTSPDDLGECVLTFERLGRLEGGIQEEASRRV